MFRDTSRQRPRMPRPGLILLGLAVAIGGCTNQGTIVRLSQERDRLATELERAKRDIASRDARIRRLEDRINALTRMSSDRPVDLFAPVRIEILSRSGGWDYDNVPGDDGVRVYLRPIDADGHAVKAPGAITIRLQDNSDLSNPRDLGVSVFNAPDVLRSMWYGRFGTDHYTADCQFRPGVRPAPPGRVLVIAEFRDFLTGRALTATREVDVAPPGSPRVGAGRGSSSGRGPGDGPTSAASPRAYEDRARSR